jgi:tRNA(Arg) A34 adenosine deaminase TadA
MFRMPVHSSSGACDCVWLYCSGSMCVGVTVWFGWGGVVSLCRLQPYVYWTVHHLDSWIKIVQLMSLDLFFAQHVSNTSTFNFRSLRLIVDLFHVLYCSGSMCVGVTVWFGWGGVVSLCRVKQCLCCIISLFTAQRVSNVSTSIFRSLRLIVDLFQGYHTTPTEPHRNTNTHRTRAIQHMK